MKRSIAAVAIAIALGTSSVVAPSNSPFVTASASAAEQVTQADLYDADIHSFGHTAGPDWTSTWAISNNADVTDHVEILKLHTDLPGVETDYTNKDQLGTYKVRLTGGRIYPETIPLDVEAIIYYNDGSTKRLTGTTNIHPLPVMVAHDEASKDPHALDHLTQADLYDADIHSFGHTAGPDWTSTWAISNNADVTDHVEILKLHTDLPGVETDYTNKDQLGTYKVRLTGGRIYPETIPLDVEAIIYYNDGSTKRLTGTTNIHPVLELMKKPNEVPYISWEELNDLNGTPQYWSHLTDSPDVKSARVVKFEPSADGVKYEAVEGRDGEVGLNVWLNDNLEYPASISVDITTEVEFNDGEITNVDGTLWIQTDPSLVPNEVPPVNEEESYDVTTTPIYQYTLGPSPDVATVKLAQFEASAEGVQYRVMDEPNYAGEIEMWLDGDRRYPETITVDLSWDVTFHDGKTTQVQSKQTLHPAAWLIESDEPQMSMADLYDPKITTVPAYSVGPKNTYWTHVIAAGPDVSEINVLKFDAPYPLEYETYSNEFGMFAMYLRLTGGKIYPETFKVPITSEVIYNDGSRDVITGTLEVQPLKSLVAEETPEAPEPTTEASTPVHTSKPTPTPTTATPKSSLTTKQVPPAATTTPTVAPTTTAATKSQPTLVVPTTTSKKSTTTSATPTRATTTTAAPVSSNTVTAAQKPAPTKNSETTSPTPSAVTVTGTSPVDQPAKPKPNTPVPAPTKEGSSMSTAGIVATVAVTLFALLGGLFFALKDQLPKEIKQHLPF
ncbi:hypothetical protein [Corynebacterium sp. NML120713]|nr:hypothetical protein [Corynebacterium sp. NML120713]OIR41766.1 hypothetical protein BJP06_09645 [Corynebacterium sp. NML120713]